MVQPSQHNVVDRYRYWRREAIVADLDERRHPFHVAIENWEHDLNIGTVVRNANAFLAAEVHIVEMAPVGGSLLLAARACGCSDALSAAELTRLLDEALAA